MASSSEREWEEARAERVHHEHEKFFTLPADGLTDAEQRARLHALTEGTE